MPPRAWVPSALDELGPLLLALGAVLLLVSLFAEWYEPGLNAWNAFEWLDLLLAGLALTVLAAAVGLLLSAWAVLDPERIPLLVAAALAIVAVQLLDPPPVVGDAQPRTGAWLALAACFVMGAGGVLAFGRLRLQVSFEGRDPRRRVSAVDVRSPGGSTGPGPGDEPAEGGSLFAPPGTQ